MGIHLSSLQRKSDTSNLTCVRRNTINKASDTSNNNSSRFDFANVRRSECIGNDIHHSNTRTRSEWNRQCSTLTRSKRVLTSVNNFSKYDQENDKDKQAKLGKHQNHSSSFISCPTNDSPQPQPQHHSHSRGAILQTKVVLNSFKEALSSHFKATTPVKSKGKKRSPLVNSRGIMSMSCLEKFASQLAQSSRSLENRPGNLLDEDLILRSAFQSYFASHSAIGEAYLWDFFADYKNDACITMLDFVEGGEKIYAPILDRDQINFYVKLYAKGKNMLNQGSFFDLLISAYHHSSSTTTKVERGLSRSTDFEGKEWMEAVTKSCFHHKEEMSVCFISNWILKNLPRLLIPMHKHYTHQLTSGNIALSTIEDSEKSRLEENGNEADSETEELVKGINPILMWILMSSLPPVYLTLFTHDQQAKQLNRVNSRYQLLQLLKLVPEPPKWTLLYDGAEHGMCMNRFQNHVFHYKGPTVMLLTCENDYTFLLGVDTEWKEHNNFWGGEQCFIIQLKPEFHVIEVEKKSLYANFSIRGYPLGIQAGTDPRNITLEIKSDFEYVHFKKMPCRIISMVVWGCAAPKAKTCQALQNSWETNECEKRKRVNVSMIEWNDHPDKYLLELAGYYKSYGNR